MLYCYFLEACSFQMKDRKGMDLNGRGGEMGEDSGETISGYNIWEKNVFSMKGEKEGHEVGWEWGGDVGGLTHQYDQICHTACTTFSTNE